MNIDSEKMLVVNSSANLSQESQSFAETCNVLDGLENLANVCRTCANVTEFVIPIFVGEGLHNNLAQKIQQHLPIKISEDDVLPHVVCYQCASTILAWHDLVECCLQADVTLQQRISSLTNETELKKNSNQRLEDNEESSAKKCAPRPGSEPALSETAGERADHDDDDDEPLASVAGKKAAELYGNFYGALVNFRDHLATEHEGSSPDSGDSDGSGSDEAVGDEHEDLTRGGARGRGPSAETDLELARVQTRVDGRAYYACGTCGKHLSSAQTYLFHRRIHTDERPCVCHVCGKQFRTPNGLRRHLAETHERRRFHACALCHRTFANSQNLRAHTRIHTGEKPFVCAQCGKRFTQSGSLHAHARGHSTLHPYRCAECGAQFKLRAGLARHALRHTGERPHACDACARAFRHRHELAAHALTHTDARPHACRLCGSAFRQRKALRHHCRRVHETDAADAPGLVYDHVGPYE
ncbi:zinc finger protein 771-like isoform X3 [Aricia agestis]|uniref:zinc finger protein 771-like isoform X3 n=1 Tax=Aricia agestis TaxID=91739 RepID=UPI001C20C041|nr:zinc finger protein 771-like isoform X3 [Aricia agestis]